MAETAEERRAALVERVARAQYAGINEGAPGPSVSWDQQFESNKAKRIRGAEAVLSLLESEGRLIEPREMQGPYATWWLLRSQPAVSAGYATGGLTVAGSRSLPEKIERVRRLREERPELGGWVLERVDQMHFLQPEPDPLRVLAEWYPDLSDAEVAGVLAELTAPGVVSE